MTQQKLPQKSDSQDSSDDTNDSLLAHLIELRGRLLKAAIAVLVIFAGLCIYPGPAVLYDFLATPLTTALPQGATMIATGVITPVMVPIKVTLLLAFVLALPYVLYQVWAFIAPGLYRHERRMILPLVVSSLLLFLGGVAFCYFVVFRSVFAFITLFAPASVTAAPDIEAYISFVMTMFLAFGLSFQVPVVVIVLALLGIVTPAKLSQARGYVIVGAFIVAAVVTPPDIVSQLMLAIPLCLLYELGVIVARILVKSKKEPNSLEQ